ncbi:MAG: DUF4249 domain-containing protein [Bacteroidota bacterium]
MKAFRTHISKPFRLFIVGKTENHQFDFFLKENVSRTCLAARQAMFSTQKFFSRYNPEYSGSLEMMNFCFRWMPVIFILSLLTSCTDVVDVEVQNGPERLVVEASLNWEKGTSGNAQTIRLRRSTQFFDTNTVTDVTGASVMVTNDTSGVSVIFTDQNNGAYSTNSFLPVLGQSYTLRIEYNGEVYTAKETMTAVTDITDVFQDREDGFDDEALEVHLVFTDPPGEENQYLFRFQREGDLLPDLEAAEDEFVDGNEIDWWYEIDDDDDLEPFAPGDVINIEMFGISRPYYDYIKILIDQLGGVGLFDAIPVAVRGNCINTTNPENYAFGYFRLTQVVRTQYTFVEDELSTNLE